MISNKIVGHPLSSCTQRVATVCREKGIPYQLTPVDFATGEHKSPQHLEKQPFGQVPYIDDDGFILFESRAIARYLALKYPDQGNQVIPSPSDLKAFALFEQAASIELNDFEALVHHVMDNLVYALWKGLPQDAEAARKMIPLIVDKLDGYERILSKQKYLAGDNVTIADLFHLPQGSLLECFKGTEYKLLSDPSRPNVARWWQDISSRETWKAVVQEFGLVVEVLGLNK
ncbi:hypothetical protein FRC02_006984 [Tulasnella sp. 418]|nr:hypothetical protein FRC02_006984 [Tulasnella sp. 418]